VTPAATPIDEEDNTELTTTIKVSKPAEVEVTPARQGSTRSPDEDKLLEAVQAANCTKMLDALQAGANPNIRDPKGRTPLHFMSGVGFAPGVVLLIHFGAQLDVRDDDGLTPLHMAAGYANAQTLRMLVAAGADYEQPGNSQGTPIEVVKQLGNYQLVEVWGKRKDKWNKMKKKDDKLEKLKLCMDVLLDPQKVIDETDWEDTLREVMKVIAIPV